MILKCDICGQKYMGSHAKQQMRGHLVNKHNVPVTNVMQSKFVIEVKPEEEVEAPIEEVKEVKNINENSEKPKKKTWHLISDVLEMEIPSTLRKQLNHYKKEGYVVYNFNTNQIGMEE